jgi:hypothetical protein
MKGDGRRAPLFADTFALCEWLLGRLDGEPGVLAASVCRNALALLEAVALALKGQLREERLIEADERLVALRLQLRLAAATGRLSERQVLYALERADGIGRQVGGWRRALERA